MSPQNRIVLGAVALVAVVAGFWFGLLAPKRADIAAASDQVTQAEARRSAATATLAQADVARKGYRRDYATVARLGKAVPADDDVASLVFQLEKLARANKIDFRAVKLTASVAAPAAETAAPPAESGDAKADESGDAKADEGKDGADESAATSAPVAPVVAQPPPGAVVGTAGLLTVPFTFTFDGDYLKLQRLLKAVDRLAKKAKGEISIRGRLLTIDGFALSPGRAGFPKVKAIVSATAYIVPRSDDVNGGATPQAPAGGAAGSPTSTALTTANSQGAGR